MLRSNAQIELANEFLRSTGVNIFLTGKAGTGKTTFLRSAVQQSDKRVVVAAPTGVAAINARGVTLHSLFQLPFGPNIPGAKQHGGDFAFRKIGKKKLSLIRSIELLVIDEISMVRCDLLDAVDETLRRIRRSNAPFGGVQLLMIGDVEQLSPICRDDEWQLLREHYDSPYFFSSKALQRCDYITIELKEIFRQRDSHFTELLNAVRENKISREVVDKLNSRYIANFEPKHDQGYITLTTHNISANNINQRELSKLTTPSFHFEATVKGDYPEGSYPCESNLELKVGAQVIFIKNDSSPEKRYYNGLIGTIELIDGKSISVRPNNGEEMITLSEDVWENIEYKISDESGEIEESIKGTFSQIPLKCAWAITIHKSQGLSFDKAIIDAGNSFAHGQVYVALSRCRSFEGVVLRTPISGGSIIRDYTVEGFTQDISKHEVGQKELEEHRRQYHIALLSEIFDFEEFNRITYSLSKLINAALYREYPHLSTSLRETTTATNEEILKVGQNFTKQLRSAITQSEDYIGDSYIGERLTKASQYFSDKIEPLATLIKEAESANSDAKEVAKRLKTLLAEAKELVAIKRGALGLCATGFSCEGYLSIKAKIIALGVETKEKPAAKASKEKPTISEDIVNEELYEALRAWRNDEAKSTGKPAYTVVNNRTLLEIQAICPTSIAKLKEISGMGPVKLKRYGDQIIEIVQEYRL